MLLRRLTQPAKEIGKFLGRAETYAEDFFAVLIKHAGLRVFEDNVLRRVSAFDFLGDLGVEFVLGVFGFPTTAR